MVEAREPPANTSLVVLHGYGADAANIEPVARALVRALPHVTAIVPDGCEPAATVPGGRQWWSLGSATPSQRAARVRRVGASVLAMALEELARRGLPVDRVAWAGFSQGAILSQWMAIHAKPRPVAVISFSGRFDDDSRADGPVATPVLLVHGARDPLIPFAETAHAQRALLDRGAVVERLDRPAMAHAIDPESITYAAAFLARVAGT